MEAIINSSIDKEEFAEKLISIIKTIVMAGDMRILFSWYCSTHYLLA